MLDKLAEYALKECEGDEVKAAAFIDGFTKEAAASGLAGELLSGIVGNVGKSLGTLAIGASVALAGKGILDSQRAQLHAKFKVALDQAIAMNRVLQGAPRERVENYGETIFKFAPHIACDANLMSSILANAVHGDGIDPNTIKMLSEMENRHQMNNAFSPKAYL